MHLKVIKIAINMLDNQIMVTGVNNPAFPISLTPSEHLTSPRHDIVKLGNKTNGSELPPPWNVLLKISSNLLPHLKFEGMMPCNYLIQAFQVFLCHFSFDMSSQSLVCRGCASRAWRGNKFCVKKGKHNDRIKLTMSSLLRHDNNHDTAVDISKCIYRHDHLCQLLRWQKIMRENFFKKNCILILQISTGMTKFHLFCSFVNFCVFNMQMW